MKATTMVRWAMACVASLALLACSKKDEEPVSPIVDFAPINLVMEFSDADGNDLVNPEHPNSIIKTSIRIEVEGKFFELQPWDFARERGVPTPDALRYYMPMWYGFYYAKPVEAGRPWVLIVGEFDGSKNATREIKLHGQNGITSTIKYSNKVQYDAKGYPQIERHYYHDDVEVQPDSKTGVIFRFGLGAPLSGTP